MACTSAINDPDFEGDRKYDDWRARVDAGEECYDCGSTDVKETMTGPRYAIPLFECRVCGCLQFDCMTKPTVDAWTLPLFPEAS